MDLTRDQLLTLNQYCRTCIKELSAAAHSLRDKVKMCEEESLLISDLIILVASIEVHSGDGLPQAICESCKELAMKFYKFKLVCGTADKFWRSKLIQSGNTNVAKYEAPQVNSSVNFTDAESNVTFSNDKLCKAYNSEMICTEQKLQNDYVKEDCKQENIRTLQVNNSIELDQRKEISVNVETCTLDNENDVSDISEPNLTCLVCYSKYLTEDELVGHMKSHASPIHRQTGSAKKKSTKRKLSRLNVQVSDLDSIYNAESKRTCDRCGKMFQYRASMLKHRRKHGAPPQSCQYCDFIPTENLKIAQHMEENHSYLKNISCNMCGKMFFKQTNLRLHMVVHSGVKKHTCEICGISFALACNLSAHRRLHTGERPYTCSHCGRGFTQQSALKSHEACHSDKRDYVCAECGAAFSRPGALNNHRKRHSPAKPYTCSLCNKAFTFSSERKRHMSTHTGDKNHICDVCGRRFNRRTNLKVHQRTHTGETPHVCKQCGKGFIQSHCLRTHIKTHLTPSS